MAVLGIKTPISDILIEEMDGKITRIYPGTAEKHDHSPVLLEAKRQLEEYFAGKRQVFDLPLELTGTDFQCAVLRALLEVPYGKTTTYGALAEAIGRPKVARAVGMALNKNPIPIIIPCHRVVGRDGSLTGFAWGMEAKRHLLELEKK